MLSPKCIYSLFLCKWKFLIWHFLILMAIPVSWDQAWQTCWVIGAWDVLWCQLCHVWYQPDMWWRKVRLEHNSNSDFPRSVSSKPGRKHPDCRACAIIGRKGYRSIFSWDAAMSGCSHFSNALPLYDMCWWLMAFCPICVNTETIAAQKYPEPGNTDAHMVVKTTPPHVSSCTVK